MALARVLRPGSVGCRNETTGVSAADPSSNDRVIELTLEERASLDQLEQVVERGLHTFVTVASALLEIRSRRLYRATHTRFEEYARDRFGLAPRTSYGYIEAAGVLKNLPSKAEERDSLTLSHLRALAPLTPEEQRQLAPTVSEMSVVEARRVIKAWRAGQRAQRTLDPPPPLPKDMYRTIVADPPWRFNERQGGFGDGLAEDKYVSMAREDIVEMPVADLAADDSHLYLWTPVKMIPDALTVCEAWGFRYVGLLTWAKPGLGLGTWWRVSTEHVIFGVRGKLPTAPNLRNWFQAPRTRHSQKPEEFFELVEKASPAPYLELFARRQRAGWTCWGNEVRFDENSGVP